METGQTKFVCLTFLQGAVSVYPQYNYIFWDSFVSFPSSLSAPTPTLRSSGLT